MKWQSSRTRSSQLVEKARDPIRQRCCHTDACCEFRRQWEQGKESRGAFEYFPLHCEVELLFVLLNSFHVASGEWRHAPQFGFVLEFLI